MSVSTEEGKNGERLARLEQDVLTIKEYMIRMENKLDVWNSTYVPRHELGEMFRARDKEIQELKDAKTNNKALWAAWAAVAVGLIAIIISVWPHK